MIARIWHGWTTLENADRDYIASRPKKSNFRVAIIEKVILYCRRVEFSYLKGTLHEEDVRPGLRFNDLQTYFGRKAVFCFERQYRQNGHAADLLQT
jgi:hypothetical protein